VLGPFGALPCYIHTYIHTFGILSKSVLYGTSELTLSGYLDTADDYVLYTETFILYFAAGNLNSN
jgi:hypothetical protein